MKEKDGKQKLTVRKSITQIITCDGNCPNGLLVAVAVTPGVFNGLGARGARKFPFNGLLRAATAAANCLSGEIVAAVLLATTISLAVTILDFGVVTV